MGHVCSNEVACGKSAAKAEFPGQDTCSYDARESPCIVAWICGVSTTDS